jgi:membrane protease YdiL (CAAX protease family)
MSGPVIDPLVPAGPADPPWQAVPPSRPFPSLWQALLLLVGIHVVANGVGLLVLLPGIVRDIAQHGTLTETLPLAGVGIVANSIAFGVITFLTWKLSRLPAGEAFPLRRVGFGAWLVAALTMAGGVVMAELLATAMLYLWPPPDLVLDLFRQLLGTEAPMLLSIVFLVVVAPVTEEFFFRGVLQKGLARRYGRGASVLWSGVLFGLVHGLPWQVVPATALGLLFAWWTDRTGSLWPALVAHAINNGTSYWLSRTQTPQEMLKPEPPDPVVLASGALLLLAGFGLARRFLHPAEPETVVERSPS